ncbi:MAG: hypothetical protein AB7D36_06065 [Oscillospiraceae bacterium]
MSTFTHVLQPMYTDCYSQASPAELARLIIGDTVIQMDYDGIPRQRLVVEKHGVWMADKFRLEQFKPITFLREMTIALSQRRERGVRVYYTASVMCSGEPIANAQICFVAVAYEDRRILRLAELAPMWNTPAQTCEPMRKARFTGEMRLKKTEHVRYSDCDLNHHLSSPKYLDFVCDVTDYWTGAEKLCALMQIDFVSECLPDSELRLFTAQNSDAGYVRGAHADGKTAFDAVYQYCNIGC